MARKPGRPKAGREPLNRELILKAALRLVDEQGLEALSMRSLAAQLGVDSMALYHHLPGKDALLSEVVETVFAEMRVPSAESQEWQEGVRYWARALRDLVRSHPNLAPLMIRSIAAKEPATLKVIEELEQVLRRADLPLWRVQKAAAVELMVNYVVGFTLTEFYERSGQLRTDDQRKRRQRVRERPAGQPHIQVFLVRSDERLRMDFYVGLDVILSGLECTS